MNKKNQVITIFSILVIISLPIWLLIRPQIGIFQNQTDSSQKTASSENGQANQKQSSFKAENRFSSGEKILIGADNNPDKQLAAQMYAKKDFGEAISKFQKSLETYPNDPEALIYLNNSIAAIDPNAITIGVSVPIGGTLDVAKEILRGVAQAQNEINSKNGIANSGRNDLLQIIIANDDNEPEVAKQIATEFVDNTQVEAVIGHNSSSASIAAAPIYQQGGLVMISPTSVATELSQAGNYIFRTTPTTRILAQTLAEYTIEKLHRQKIAVCSDSEDSASSSFREDFSLSVFELDGEITATECDFGSDNFNADEIPGKAIADGAEALLLIPSVDKINQALQVAQSNQNRLTLLGNHSMYGYETLKVGGSDTNGMILPVAWHPDATANSSFNIEAERLWGMAGSWRTATAYDATKALIAGLSQIDDSNRVTARQQLQKVLTDSGFSVPGVLGDITFQSSGDRLVKGVLVKIQPGTSSGAGYDFKYIN
ncbi:ABC transporter substrate-binding protein [Pleurocapsa sp. FMAR1]|uniref:ABC transporter substrate-binding protein n=1 Tax=Pleurocapsa sp. FMAR1 TaxID=3040204 RepID=UPI0029C63420|nr:ABC transporter substrate-binding protein [Pleurocapsa sp. FMAR1]